MARIIDPASKLATARGLSTDTVSSTLSEILGTQNADADKLSEAMDWLGKRQQEIEQALVAKHLQFGSLILRRCDFHPCLREQPVPSPNTAIPGTRRKGNYKSFLGYSVMPPDVPSRPKYLKATLMMLKP
ncbi:hypothetical protein NDA07_23020 [Microcoleus vaginatus DQ-U2]|uniref:hypothetical protein n=1 Tax=Microcoleus vaginatus TaxID=119532 RepID=UPI0032A4D93F